MSFRLLVILAAAFWLPALVFCAVGFFITPQVIALRYAAIPDAVLAIVFTALAASRWVKNPPR